MSNSRGSWVTAIVCLCVLAAAEIGVRVAEPTLPDLRGWPTAESELKYHQMSEDRRGVDVVFVGTSSMEAAIDPERFEAASGLAAYNAALPFSRPPSTALWVDEAVIPLLRPSTLVMGVLPETLTDERDILVGPLKGALNPDQPSSFWQHSALLRRRRQLNALDETVARMGLLASGFWTDAGHQMGYYDDQINSVHTPNRELRLSRARLEEFVQIVRRAQAMDVQVIVLFEPVLCLDELRGRCQSDEEIRNAVDSQMADLGVTVLRVPGMDPSLFAEPSHLNRAGTTLFTDSAAAAIGDLVERS